MEIPIFYLVTLIGQAWLVQLLCRAFGREIQSTRRRDLTLAGGDHPLRLSQRFEVLTWDFVVHVTGLGLLEFVVFVAGGTFIAMGVEYRAVVGLCFAVTFLSFMKAGICHGVVSTFAARACRHNRPLSLLAMPIALVVAEIAVWQVPVSMMLVVVTFSELHADLAPAVFVIASMIGGLITGSIAVYMVFVFPGRAWNKLLKAYPYSE